jgi:hypothetical protein
LKSLRKDGFFDAPFDLFKEKKFSSLRRDNELFCELKRSKREETAQNFENGFIKTDLDFHCPSKILCHTPKYNIVKITGSLRMRVKKIVLTYFICLPLFR